MFTRKSTLPRMSLGPSPAVPEFGPLQRSDSRSHQSTTFTLVSYNILAQAYVKSLYFPDSPSSCLKWKARSFSVLSVLKTIGADFYCLQELDEFEPFYKPKLEDSGYSCVYVKRTGTKRDGCGIFFKRNRAQSLMEETIEFNDLVGSCDTSSVRSLDDLCSSRDLTNPLVRLKRDCVGVMVAFELKSSPPAILVVANVHLYWDPDLADVKLAQAKYLVQRLGKFNRKVMERYGSVPALILAGDFNSTPGDPVYEYILKESGGEFRSPLRSCYGETIGEPAFTNCTPDFTDTLDYVFYSPPDRLRPLRLLQLPDKDSPDVANGLPNFLYPSDHLPIGALFELKES